MHHTCTCRNSGHSKLSNYGFHFFFKLLIATIWDEICHSKEYAYHLALKRLDIFKGIHKIKRKCWNLVEIFEGFIM